MAESGVAMTLDTNSQSPPSLLSDGAGGVFVVWADARNGLTISTRNE